MIIENVSNCRHYDLIDYFDVWYNDFDGWTVNNQCVAKTNIIITDDTTEEDIIEYLKQNEFLVSNCTVDDFDVLMDIDFIEILEKKNGKPLFCFHEVFRG